MNQMYDKKEFFSTYFANASEKPLFLDRFATEFKCHGKTCEILDLGSHDGALIFKLLDQISHMLPDFTKLVAVDPSAEAIAHLKERKIKNGVKIETHVSTAESFFNEVNDLYDWIIASHCLYWTADLESTINSIIQRGKRAVIVFRGKKGIFEIQSKFKDLLGNKNEKLYSAEDIERCLLRIGHKFHKEEHQTQISIPAPDRIEFKWLVSFFLQTSDGNITESSWNSLTAFFRPYQGVFRHDVSFFWI